MIIYSSGSSNGVVSDQSVGINTSANYSPNMTYENMHRIAGKNQSHNRDGASVGVNTYSNVYTYGNNAHPNAVTSITNGGNVQEFTYDANGNTLTHTLGEDKNMLWDEGNMLKSIMIADQSMQHYIYDAGGERTMKGKGSITLVSVNGQPQSQAVNIGNYSLYVSGYLVVGGNGHVTKHYYNGGERVTSRLGGLVSGYHSGTTQSGSQSASLPQRQTADLEYIFNEFELDSFNIINQPPIPGDCEVACNCASTLYYFHPDHVGSSTFLSDENGQPYQFLLYLPFGESMAGQKAGGWATPYKFNGKELDEETGMYYYGARYYDPSVSLWHGVDPLAEKMPEWSPYTYTFNNPIRYIDPDGRMPQQGGPGDPQMGAVIGGTIKAGLLNLIGLGIKYSQTPRGAMMRATGMSYHFSLREDPSSPNGVEVGGEIRFDQSALHDAGNGALAAMDLAPLAPSKGGVALLAKTPGVFTSAFLKNASSAFREAYSGGRHAKTLELSLTRTASQNQKTINSFTELINNHKSYIKDPSIKYGDRWSGFSEARKQRELNHWKSEIKGFQEQIDVTRDVIKTQE